ncbi:MAG TPA: tetratricopeptide repeat protein [Candidatus Polarisedimenticolia bacterium]|nr:tetratricopeptide repeat protein [Candidatus Polarisedimenticolia bacterium]
MSEALIARYSDLTAEGTQHLRRGEFRCAADCFESARRVAEDLDDQQLRFKALCNLSTARLSLGEVPQAETGLREILLESPDPQVVFVASSNLASSLRRQGRLEKALFYARRALRCSETLDNASWKATCHNLIGNIYMNMSHLDDAMTEYRFALSISEKHGLGTSYPVDYIKENLGYCTLLKKRYRQGIAIILEALQIALQNENSRCVAESHQDLSFAYMQLRELPQAREYGEKALALAEEKAYKDILKNCYYLLGEINLQIGDEERSDFYFGKLQELYPHLAALKDFLRTFDVSNIINLKNPF